MCRFPPRTTSVGDTCPSTLESIQFSGFGAMGLKVSHMASGRRFARLPNHVKLTWISGSASGSTSSRYKSAGQAVTAGAGRPAFSIRKRGHDSMLALILVRQALRQPGRPHPALGPEFFDVRFAEILRRPIGLNRDIAGEETIVVAFGERLVAERRQRMCRPKPIPGCRPCCAIARSLPSPDRAQS